MDCDFDILSNSKIKVINICFQCFPKSFIGLTAFRFGLRMFELIFVYGARWNVNLHIDIL
jgi:hypothetical protein